MSEGCAKSVRVCRAVAAAGVGSRAREYRKGVVDGLVVLRRHSQGWSRLDATADGIAMAGKARVSSLTPSSSWRRAVENAIDRTTAMLCF